MRSHREIIQTLGTTAFAREIGADPNNVHQWKRADSIPADRWQAVATAKLATLEELATAAAARKRAAEQDQAA